MCKITLLTALCLSGCSAEIEVADGGGGVATSGGGPINGVSDGGNALFGPSGLTFPLESAASEIPSLPGGGTSWGTPAAYVTMSSTQLCQGTAGSPFPGGTRELGITVYTADAALEPISYAVEPITDSLVTLNQVPCAVLTLWEWLADGGVMTTNLAASGSVSFSATAPAVAGSFDVEIPVGDGGNVEGLVGSFTAPPCQ